VTAKQKIELQPRTAQEWYEAAVLTYQAKSYKTSLGLIAKAITLDPDNSKYHAFIGVVLKKTNHLKESLKAFKKALELNPKNLDALHNLGSFYFESGLPLKSEPYFKQALEINPEHHLSLNAMGMLHLQAGNKNLAEEFFLKTLDLKPDFHLAFLNLADLHLHLHQPKIALTWLQKVETLIGENLECLLKKAKAYLALGNLSLCEQLCLKALQIDVDSAQGNAVLGQCYQKLGQYELAHQAFQKVQLSKQKQTAHTHASIGLVYFEQIKDYVKAKEHYQNALTIAPDYLIAHLQLASLHIIEGVLEKAEEHLNRILTISPMHPQAYRLLAHIRKTDAFEEKSLTELEHELEGSEHNESLQSELRYALADCLDQQQDYDRAFKHLKMANEISSKKSEFNLAHLKNLAHAQKCFFTKEKIASLSKNGSRSTCPVFIVGMPRSGTTLTEQILSSHPSIFGAGELQDMSELKFKFQSKYKQSFPAVLENIDSVDFNNIAEVHIEHLHQLAPDATRVIDKMPFNFYLIGMIACLFPNAKIIHSVRHPLDTCLSCYFLKFSDRMTFSYDLENLGQVYQIHSELMEHWKTVLPNRIYTQSYEELVKNPERETKRLLDYLELDWNDDCLMHHKNTRPVRTASNWQVRQPIYQTSIHRWKNYRQHLGPLAEILEFNLDQDLS